MDSQRIDRLARRLAAPVTRRAALATLAALGLPGVARPAAARNRRTRGAHRCGPADGCVTPWQPCPGVPTGPVSRCVSDLGGRPLCVERFFLCEACTGDRDCADLGYPKITRFVSCAACEAPGTACATPYQP